MHAQLSDSLLALKNVLAQATMSQNITNDNYKIEVVDKFTYLGIIIKTKVSVYNDCVLSTLLYGSESWTTYPAQERILNI